MGDLRDRIAQVIYGDGNELAWPRCVQLADVIIWERSINNPDLVARIANTIERSIPDRGPSPDFTGVAVSVIAELGLVRDPFSTVAFSRYVTQWEPNERFRHE